MIFQDMLKLMEEAGYQRVKSNVPEICLFCKKVQEQSLYVFLTDTVMKGSQSPRAVQGVILQLGYKLKLRDPGCEFLTILITGQIQEYRKLSAMQESIWFVDKDQQKLIIYENQKENFTQLHSAIEKLFDQYYKVTEPYGVQSDDIQSGSQSSPYQTAGSIVPSRKEQFYAMCKKLPVCCSIIVAVNVLVFLIMDVLMNDYEYNKVINDFGILWVVVKNQKEYYRLFTYMFLHSGLDHLFNNMLILFFVGQSLECVISKSKFIAIYFGSGIIAGVVSMGYNMINNRNVLSVGASGAIFGLVGAMLYVVLINRGRLREISTRQILLFIVFSLYGGFASGNVDNAAHIGGFLGGVFLATILIRRGNRKEREN